MDWLDFIFGLLEPILPDPIGQLTIGALMVLGSLIGLYQIRGRYANQNTIFIRHFQSLGDAPLDRSRVVPRLGKQLQEIRSVHEESALKAAGDAFELGTPKRLNENHVSFFAAVAVDISPVMLPHKVAYWVWPRLELVGVARLQGSKLRWDCGLTRRVPLPPLYAEAECKEPDPELEVSEEMAYKIVTRFSPLPPDDRLPFRVLSSLLRRFQKHDGTTLGTTEWDAFKAHTEALRLWNSPDFDIPPPEQEDGTCCSTPAKPGVKKVGAKLKESIDHDPNYALAHYNQAVLTYGRHESPGTNELARKSFRKAAELAKNSEDVQMEGLALVGVSRCYSQDRHRYGRMEAEVVQKARDAADCAIKLLSNDPRAQYASAFAWHCTETLKDIRMARPIYEEIIREYPDKYIAVYNNLGYILMVGGELLQARGNDKEAQEAQDWWVQAAGHMKKAIELKKTNELAKGHPMAAANLGNLHRLRGEYPKALEYYWKSLNGDPKTSNYTEGLNELARLFFDMGLSKPLAAEAKAMYMTQGLHHHQRALRNTAASRCCESGPGNQEQLQKLMRDVVDILRKKNHPAEARIASLYQRTSEAEKPADAIETWLAELAGILESDVV